MVSQPTALPTAAQPPHYCNLLLTVILVAFTGVTHAHGPSPQPTAFRSPKGSLSTATGSNKAQLQGFEL